MSTAVQVSLRVHPVQRDVFQTACDVMGVSASEAARQLFIAFGRAVLAEQGRQAGASAETLYPQVATQCVADYAALLEQLQALMSPAEARKAG